MLTSPDFASTHSFVKKVMQFLAHTHGAKICVGGRRAQIATIKTSVTSPILKAEIINARKSLNYQIQTQGT